MSTATAILAERPEPDLNYLADALTNVIVAGARAWGHDPDTPGLEAVAWTVRALECAEKAGGEAASVRS